MRKYLIIFITLFLISPSFAVELKRNWKIFFIPQTHLDIGYTHTQDEVMQKQWNNLTAAMDIMERTQGYPKEARFKWSAESTYTFETFLNQASEKEKERFFYFIKNGQMGSDGLFANLLYGLNRPEELRQALSFKEKLEKLTGHPMDSAMVSDVPGWSWGLPEVLSNYGVKYLSLGPNQFDRIGYTIKDWGDKPFYWVSPSGAKVLTFIHGLGYSSFGYPRKVPFPKNAKSIFEYLQKLEDEKYPYDIIPIRYTFDGADNAGPDANLPEKVIEWNKKNPKAQISLTTVSEALGEFERQYGNLLPQIAGEFSPYWTDGVASTARETAIFKNASEELDQLQTLYSILRPNDFPENIFHQAWNNVLLFSEHTWGAHNSVSRPNLDFVKSQWEWKKNTALNAKNLSLKLKEDLLAEDLGSKIITVYNNHSWPVSGLVKIKSKNPIGLESIDGKKIYSQSLSSDESIFFAENVPALGFKTFNIINESLKVESGCQISDHSMSNGIYKIEFEPKYGTIKSIISLKDNREFVKKDFEDKFNEYIYISGHNPSKGRRKTLMQKTEFEILQKGPLVCSMKISRRVFNSNSLVTIVTLSNNSERIDLENILDRPVVRRKEGIHFAFPVNANNPKIKYDVTWGVVDISKDLMSGACKNYFTPLRWVDISGSDQGMMIVLQDAPLIESGEITMDAKKNDWTRDLLQNGVIYSYVMNNYWHTNYKADQPGITSFRYSLFPHTGYDGSANIKKSLEVVQPLLGQRGENIFSQEHNGISINNDSIIIESAKVKEAGLLEINLFNTSDKSQSGTLSANYCQDLYLPNKKILDGALDFNKFEMKRIYCSF
jgi:alpha-mannosidase